MLQLRLLTAAFVLALASALAAAPAFAQGTKVVVVDQNRVLTESRAGQDIQTKIENIEAEMQRELEPTAQSLQSLGETIEAKTANMTPEAMRADTDLQQQARSYQSQLQSFASERDKRATELAITERRASIAFGQALKPVLESVMAEEGAQVMLQASDVVLSLPAVDVTDKVIARLDAEAPTIAVTRERLPEQASQQ